ncbi:unnamed protein product [Nezara viridula]|uniref:Uncharacterized protein n=1 Tax=Nezara viridula TaxID=85310 RepID=A0A9P0E5I7_NEZVI|nr:unnamed protein product [Nezara viridula]
MLYIQLLLAAGVLSVHSVLSISFKEATEACTKIHGIDANMEKMDFKDPDFPQQKKCAVACILDKKDVFKDDGSIDIKKDKKLLEEALQDEELREKYLKAVDECDIPVKKNKCETAYEFVKCKETNAGLI